MLKTWQVRLHHIFTKLMQIIDMGIYLLDCNNATKQIPITTTPRNYDNIESDSDLCPP